MIDKISKYIDDNGIILDECDMLDKFGKAALYCHINNQDIILLNPNFKDRDIRDQVDILAEECGHYATSIGDTFISPATYSDRLKIDKSEHKAILWASNYFIDKLDLIRYIRLSTSVEELTDYLGISYSMLYEYLYNLKNKGQYLELGDGSKLDLYKLPNLVIISEQEGVIDYEES